MRLDVCKCLCVCVCFCMFELCTIDQEISHCEKFLADAYVAKIIHTKIIRR